VGQDLRDSLVTVVGPQATMAKSEVVFGLAAIVTQLKFTHTRKMQSILTKWAEQSGVKIKEGIQVDMFEVLRQQIVRKYDVRKSENVHGALWMIDEEEGRWSNAVEAFTAHAEMAKKLAEVVVLTLESWNLSMPQGSPGSGSSGSSAPSGLVDLDGTTLQLSTRPPLQFPEAFGSPAADLTSWLKWKTEKQGRVKEGTATYMLARTAPNLDPARMWGSSSGNLVTAISGSSTDVSAAEHAAEFMVGATVDNQLKS
jgi:hypothetical protein